MKSTDPTDPTLSHASHKPAESSEAAWDAGLAAAFIAGETGSHLSTNDPDVGTVLAGKYRLSERIGEGGMGSVWVAHQSEPVKRKVAIKLIKAGMDSKQVLARFEAERQALAMMDHPNIAKVLDGGLHDGRPFFVMELVKGVPITQFCDERKLTPKERLELFVPVCQAIQHAHQKGIIHRDIKPSNVMIALYDDRAVPKVIDFGVAKATGGALTERTIDTAFGGVVGTPQYMSPEQATLNNLDIDTRSDVYSLGVLLYELLAGSPPFARKELEKKGLLEILRVVREEEPQRPSTKLSTADALPTLSANRGTEPKKLTSLLRNELDWIVMKALEKDRALRYDTANALAKDVQRYISGDAVEACPPTLGYRLRKAYRKNRATVFALAGAGVAVVLIAAALVYGFMQAGKKREFAILVDRAEAAKTDAEESRDAATTLRIEAEQSRETLSRIEYGRTIDLAYRDFHANNIERANELLNACDVQLRGWEWRYVARQLHPEDVCLFHEASVRVAAFSPNGAWVATGSGDGVVRLNETAGGKMLREFERDDSESRMVNSVQFSSDGKRLLVAYYKSARVWDTTDGKQLLRLDHSDTVFSASFSPDGSRISTCCQDRKARVWDAVTGKELLTVDRYKKLYGPIRFDPRGVNVLTIDGEQAVRLWDSTSGEERLTIPQQDYPHTATFSPNGQRIACAGSDKWARVFDSTSGKLLKTLKVDRESINDLCFSTDGQRIATAGSERTVRIWDVDSEVQVSAIRSHAGAVTAVAYVRNADNPSGADTLLTASDDRTARIWREDHLPDAEIWRPMISILSLTLSPNGKYVAIGGRDGEVQVWDLFAADVVKGQRVWAAQHSIKFVRSLAFSHDGKRLASASEDNSVQIRNVADGKILAENTRLSSATQCVAFHPTKDELVCTGLDGSVCILNAHTSAVVQRLEHPPDPVYAAAFTPDGQFLLTGGWDGQ